MLCSLIGRDKLPSTVCAREIYLTFQIFKHSDPVLASGDRESAWRGDQTRKSIGRCVKKKARKPRGLWVHRVPAGSARDRTPVCAPLLGSFSSCLSLVPFLVYHHSNYQSGSNRSKCSQSIVLNHHGWIENNRDFPSRRELAATDIFT